MAFKKKQTKTALELLSEQSTSAISIIHKLIDQLKRTNEEITLEKQANEEKIAKILSEQDSLNKLREDNDKIVANFASLLGQTTCVE